MYLHFRTLYEMYDLLSAAAIFSCQTILIKSTFTALNYFATQNGHCTAT